MLSASLHRFVAAGRPVRRAEQHARHSAARLERELQPSEQKVLTYLRNAHPIELEKLRTTGGGRFKPARSALGATTTAVKRVFAMLCLVAATFACHRAYTFGSRMAQLQSPTAVVRQVEAPTATDSTRPMLPALSVYSSPAQVANPRFGGGWVTDSAGLLSASAKRELNELAEGVRGTGAEIAVVTVHDVTGTPKAFATRLFNRWGVGHPLRHNGVLVLLVPGQRRVEVEIGRGLERSFNEAGWLQRMEDCEMSPRYKQGDWDGGTLRGVRLIARRLRGLDGATLEVEQLAAARRGRNGAVLAAAAAAGCAGSLVVSEELSKPRCARCGRRMRGAEGNAWNAEEASDERRLVEGLLSPEERLEQRLGSCAFTLHACTAADCEVHRADVTREGGWGAVDPARLAALARSRTTVGVRRAPRLLSPYERCGHCRRRTRLRRTVVLRAATYARSGRAVTFADCLNCGDATERLHVLAKLRESSDGGGSGFGGGSSDGGGSGSSW